MTARQEPHRVAVLAYDGLCTFEFGIAMEVFALPRPELPVPWYTCRACTFDGQPIRMLGNLSASVPHGPRTLAWADTIVVPGWGDLDTPVPDAVVRALARAHRRGARLVSICSGVFALAAAGVLEGRRATTHWRYVDRLRTRFPQIHVEPDALYVDDDQVLTSAGSAAGLDLCLHIVKKDHGSEIANAVARRLVLPAHREGGQTQYVPAPVGQDDAPLAPLLDQLRASLDTPHSVASMARAIGQSQRTFIRRFREATGQSPHAWLTAERVRLARLLLETTSDSVEHIADRCGFGSAETFRHHFRRQVGIPPTRYRASFQNG